VTDEPNECGICDNPADAAGGILCRLCDYEMARRIMGGADWAWEDDDWDW